MDSVRLSKSLRSSRWSSKILIAILVPDYLMMFVKTFTLHQNKIHIIHYLECALCNYSQQLAKSRGMHAWSFTLLEHRYFHNFIVKFEMSHWQTSIIYIHNCKLFRVVSHTYDVQITVFSNYLKLSDFAANFAKLSLIFIVHCNLCEKVSILCIEEMNLPLRISNVKHHYLITFWPSTSHCSHS